MLDEIFKTWLGYMTYDRKYNPYKDLQAQFKGRRSKRITYSMENSLVKSREPLWDFFQGFSIIRFEVSKTNIAGISGFQRSICGTERLYGVPHN